MAKEETKKIANGSEPKKKLTYDELMGLAAKMDREIIELRKKLGESQVQLAAYQMEDYWKRLDWLWKVITLDYASSVFGDEFYQQKVDEFVKLMTPVEEKEQE